MHPALRAFDSARADVWRELAVVVVLLCSVLAGWMLATERWRPSRWTGPLEYSGDALYYLAMAKASAESHAVPFLWKEVPRLNAPYGATWNDFPIVNEPLWSLLGISRKLFGLAGTSQVPVLGAHLLAALGFYLAARCWGGGRAGSATMALLFALAPYLFRRNFVHLNLSLAYHVPLAVVVALWAAQPAGLARRGRWFLGIAVAVLCGLQATYYAMFFLLLLSVSVMGHAAGRHWDRLARPALLGVLTVALAAAGNLDTLTFRAAHGAATGALQRSLRGIEIYSLKPIELFLPRGQIQPWIHELTDRLYYSQLPLNSESGSAYLGLVGAIGLLWLLANGLLGLLVAADRRPAPEVWAALTAVGFAVAGGANTALGVAGIQLFRAGNRISVLLLAISLLFLVRTLEAWAPRRRTAVLAVAVALGLWDQLPRRSPGRDAQHSLLFHADKALANALETRIPGGAIFDLPVSLYPEAPSIGAMDAYEPLRLYFHSWSLRFSYGAHKGRGFEVWQKEVANLPWPAAIARLQSMGFSAIAVHGLAFPDGGAEVVAAIEAAGGGPTLSHQVQPIRVILLPTLQPETHSPR